MSRRREILTRKLGDRRFSFGYSWSAASSETTLRTEAMAEAALPSVQADVVALRAGDGHAQFGLGWLAPDDRQKGAVAAHAFAAEHAKQTIRKALGVFEIPGAMWLAVLDQDIIDHDGDQVFIHPGDALAAFTEFLEQHYWDRLYLPESYISQSVARYEEAQEAGELPSALDSIVYKRRHTTTSTPISSVTLDHLMRDAEVSFHIQRKIRRADVAVALRSKPALALYAMIAIGLVYVSPNAYRWAFPEKKAAETTAKASTPAPAMPVLPPQPVLNTPVPSLPSSAQFAAHCVDLFAALDDPLPPGWSDRDLRCSVDGASLIVDRVGGTPDTLEEAIPGASFHYDDTYGSATVTLPVAKASGVRQGDLAPAEELRRRLYALGWAADEQAVVGKFGPPPGRLLIDSAKWLQAPLTITSPTDPREWAAVLDQIPGVTLSIIAIDPHEMKTNPLHVRWTIEGTVYAR